MNAKRLGIWLKALRAPFFTSTIAPVVLGSVLAWHDSYAFSWPRFWLTLIGAVLINAGTNLSNDYFDHLSGCDRINPNPTPFSGGSRVIQEGLIRPRNILYASLIAFAISVIIGLYLNWVSGSNVILILGILGIFLGFFYTAKPFRIGYGGLGELSVSLCLGPLVVLGAYYVQAQALSLRVFLISIPVGILVALILFINEFQDYTADKEASKRTLVVILGKRRAVILYHILLLCVYIVAAALVLLRFLPVMSLIVFFSLPLALKAYIISKNNFDKIYELLPANAFTIGLHFIVGLLLCVGLVLDKIL